MKILEYILGYQVDQDGVIRNRRNKKVITALGRVDRRQRRRYFFKVLSTQFQQLANAAGRATAGGWNH